MPSHTTRPGASSALPLPSLSTTSVSASAPTSTSTATSASAISASSMSAAKSRQYAHCTPAAQLNAHLADMENLMRMTSAQAGDMRFLGGYVGGLFMGAAQGARGGRGGEEWCWEARVS
ncbi:predicted protein [Uncinocarpus reesii 1704]|uniref:Uncharacterized protein n=1 Tax=Uncinocarpus reesii (strain UAMH 1704) TaxID=336963 RepID=C4JU29_UNCRE|nr:uncharacterized protein UREG_05968 [Uncinocarpus reesii 1704]EEP81126.1 predicted protein [Uncinocarpus reesii 1704]